MDQPEEKYTSPASLIVDAILCVGFFLFMYQVLAVHVPSRDPHMVLFWGCMGTACLTGVFWLAVQMFRVVVRAQFAAKRLNRQK